MSAIPSPSLEIEDEMPAGPRIPVTELRPFAPASGAYLGGEMTGDGRAIQLSFDPGDGDGTWSAPVLEDWFEDMAALPRNTPLRLLGRLTRSREDSHPRLRVWRVTDPAGNILWHAIPAGRIALAGTYQSQPLEALTDRRGRALTKPVPSESVAFWARALSHDPELLGALEAIPADAPVEAFTQPDNYLRDENWYACPHCSRRHAFDRHEPGCPLGDEQRFLLGIRYRDRFIMIGRRGAGTARRLRLFADEGKIDWFEIRHQIKRGDLLIDRYDPAHPEPWLAAMGLGSGILGLDELPAHILQPVPAEFRRGLGAMAPDPGAIAPVELSVRIHEGDPVAWQTEESPAPPNVYLWPQGRDGDDEFAHSLTIFELSGGRAALADAVSAVEAGRVWCAGREEAIGDRPDFHDVAIYDGEEQIAYAYE